MSQDAFEQFRQHVLSDIALQQRLQQPTDFQTFLPLVIQIGREAGYEFSAEEVEAATRHSRRAWLERAI